MRKGLLAETFGGLNDGIVGDGQANQPAETGIVPSLGNSILSGLFTGVLPTGEVYTTMPAPGLTVAVPSSAARTPAEAAAIARQVAAPPHPAAAGTRAEATIAASTDTLGSFIGGILTNIWAPIAGKLDDVAINRGWIPTVPDILGEDLLAFQEAVQRYHERVAQFTGSPATQQLANQSIDLVVDTAAKVKGFDADTSTNPSTQLETKLAYEVVKELIGQAVTEMGGSSCGYCHQFPCHCSAQTDAWQYLEAAEKLAQQMALTHNRQLADSTVRGVISRQAQSLAAQSLQQELPEKEQLELIHLTPSRMLIAALLSDWTQIPKAISAAIIPNEAGKRGTSIILQKQPKELGGNQLVVSTGAVGLGANEGQGIPMNFVPKWQQPDWQTVVSDSKKMNRKWGKTKHGTVPEVGKLTIASPAAPDRVKATFPLAVRFPHREKPMTGGAAVLPMAIQIMLGIQDVADKLLGTAPSAAADPNQLTQTAVVEGTQAVVQNGIRAKVIASRAQQIIENLARDPHADQVAANLNPDVLREQQLAELTRQAAETQRQKLNEIALAINNFRHAQAISHATYKSGNKSVRYVMGPEGILPPTQWRDADFVRDIPSSELASEQENILDWTTTVIASNATYLLDAIADGTLPPQLTGLTRQEVAQALAYHASHTPEPPKTEQPVTTKKKKGFFSR